MTLEIGSQKVGRFGRRGRGTPTASSLPIGELDANIFACPACSRPLGTGTRRCPGCATRLIAGVKASRAVVFVGVGGLCRLRSRRRTCRAHDRAQCAAGPGRHPACPAGRHAEPGADRRRASAARGRPRHPQQRPVGPAPDDPHQPARRHRCRASLHGARGLEAFELRDRAHPPCDGLDRDGRPAARADRRQMGSGRVRVGGLRRVLRRHRQDGRRGTLVVAVEQPRVRGGCRGDASRGPADSTPSTRPRAPWPPPPTSRCHP